MLEKGEEDRNRVRSSEEALIFCQGDADEVTNESDKARMDSYLS